MGVLRAVWRIAVLCVITPVFFGLYVLGGLLGGRGQMWSRRAWARNVARTLNVRIEIVGKVPTPPFILVTNHLSYLDIAILLSEVNGVFVAKSEVARWPIMGFLASASGTIYVERARKSQLPDVLKKVTQALSNGGGVVFFPEGTSSSGASVLRFKASLFEVAVLAGLPVHTASMHYETPAGSKPAWLSVAWWGDMDFAGHLLRLLTLPSIRARVTFADEPVMATDRKTFADETHRAVTATFEPMTECESR